jgi:UDP-N-acetylmuramyl pentapeptide phosphotransferase/UDP-N-acetylglucosamine-1-phosphate transferase
VPHATSFKLGAALLTAFVLTYTFIPSIIKVAIIKHLYDSPDDDRKSHDEIIPTLGGIGIFGGFVIGFCLFATFDLKTPELKYIIAALSFTFMLGAKDDIVALVANKKFIGQIFAASIIVILGGIRITSLYGMFGISYISDAFSIILSIVTIIFIINAFNLIDGINLLAGSISVVISLSFGAWFYFYGFNDYAILAAAMSGAVLAFLRYNFTPAKIFMGDSGSLSIGLLAAVLAIQFIEKNEMVLHQNINAAFRITASPAMAIAVLIIPIYDTFRVFTMRLFNKKSPFIADRNHIHHRLLDLGLTHVQSTFVLVLVNLLFIFLAYFLQHFGNFLLMIFELAFAILLTMILFSFGVKKKIVPNKEVKENDEHVNLKNMKIDMQ